ncbi:MAG: hypothetical protein ABWY12_09745 [Burkholderiales bacterium]
MGAPSSYSKNLGLELIATGAKATTWGVITNRNLDTIDESVHGMSDIFLGGTSYTLTTTDGAISPGHSKVIRFTGAPAGECLITISPDHREHVYFMVNETTSRLVFTQGTGGNFALDPPYAAVVHCQGIGAASRVWGTLANLQVRDLRVLATIIMGPGSSAILNSVVLNGSTVFGGPAEFQQGINVGGLVGQFQQGITVAGNLGFTGPMTQSGSGLVRLTGLVHVNQLRIDNGADQVGDMYFRGNAPNFFLTRIPPAGAVGNVLTWAATGPQWSTGGLSLNMPATGFQERNLVGVQSGQVKGTPFWWNTVWGGVSRTPGFAPLFAFHVWAPAGDKLMIDGDGTAGMGMRWGVNALMRWELVLTDSEAGGNSGSNLTLVTGTDAGAASVAPMRCVRSTGNIIFGNTNLVYSIGQVNIIGPDGRICLFIRVGPGAAPSAPAIQLIRADGTTAFLVNNNGDVGAKSYVVI